jgi:hypothetical protein
MVIRHDWGDLLNYALVLLLIGVVFLVLAYRRSVRRAQERAREAEHQALLAEDQHRYDIERSWVASGQWPLTHYDVYPTDWELTQDLARLKAMGYSIEWQEHTADGVAVTYSLAPAYLRQAEGRP